VTKRDTDTALDVGFRRIHAFWDGRGVPEHAGVAIGGALPACFASPEPEEAPLPAFSQLLAQVCRDYGGVDIVAARLKANPRDVRRFLVRPEFPARSWWPQFARVCGVPLEQFHLYVPPHLRLLEDMRPWDEPAQETAST